jgi:hypothetical protein
MGRGAWSVEFGAWRKGTGHGRKGKRGLMKSPIPQKLDDPANKAQLHFFKMSNFSFSRRSMITTP